MDEQYEKDLKRFLVPLLRRGTYRWYARNQALSLARVSRGVYKCAMCGGHFPKKEIRIDHIHPVVALDTGFTNWHDFVTRMFPPADHFQILCEQDHETKTNIEKEIRKEHRKRRKLSEINKDMDKVNKRKPSKKQLEVLKKALEEK